MWVGAVTCFVIVLLQLQCISAELYSNTFILEADVDVDEAKRIAERYGFVFDRQQYSACGTVIFRNYFNFHKSVIIHNKRHMMVYALLGGNVDWSVRVPRDAVLAPIVVAVVYTCVFITDILATALGIRLINVEQVKLDCRSRRPVPIEMAARQPTVNVCWGPIRNQIVGEYFLLIRPEIQDKSTRASKWKSRSVLKRHPKVKSIQQEEYIIQLEENTDAVYESKALRENQNLTSARKTRATNDDDEEAKNWEKMWHLNPKVVPSIPSLMVEEAWSNGYSGQDVTVAIVDNGLDQTHPDLSKNFNQLLSYNFVSESNDVSHDRNSSGHGTSCAGIVAAEKNNKVCIPGIAYKSPFAAIKILGKDGGKPSQTASGVIHKAPSIHIYSNSYGVQHDFIPQPVVERALKEGIEKGRSARGSIYTFSAGNRGRSIDCNTKALLNSVYTIAVNSVGRGAKLASYAQMCTSVMTSTYGGDRSYLNGGMITTGRDGSCIDSFDGTSSACPVASGIIALALQANSYLTWRDVQHLIVETSTTSSLHADGRTYEAGAFVTNGAGKKVSRMFGFGLVNAYRITQMAKKWKEKSWTVPPQIREEVKPTETPMTKPKRWTAKFTMKSNICHLEHVQVWIKSSLFSIMNAAINIKLTSAMGMTSILVNKVANTDKQSPVATSWTFLTLHSWGENPNGEWILNIESDHTFVINDWKLIIRGADSNPLTAESITTTAAPPTVTNSKCTFELDDKQCKWTSPHASCNGFSFKKHKGATDSENTGPSTDRLGSDTGYYLLAEASNNENLKTKLTSPILPGGNYCIEFFYHMFGSDMGRLWMKLLGTTRKMMWNISGNHGDKWNEKAITIRTETSANITIQLEVGVKIGKGYRSDMAIDDLTVTPGECSRKRT